MKLSLFGKQQIRVVLPGNLFANRIFFFLIKKKKKTHMALFITIIKTAQIYHVEKLEISHLPSGQGPGLMLCIFPALGILPLVLKYLVFF